MKTLSKNIAKFKNLVDGGGAFTDAGNLENCDDELKQKKEILSSKCDLLDANIQFLLK